MSNRSSTGYPSHKSEYQTYFTEYEHYKTVTQTIKKGGKSLKRISLNYLVIFRKGTAIIE